MNNSKRIWTEVEIVALINSNDRAVEKAMVAIYNRQTVDEKVEKTTKHNNTVGFSAPDAGKGTYYAKWVLSGYKLTGKHLAKARELAVKYRRQLTKEANRQ